jgi:hypothetical protein
MSKAKLFTAAAKQMTAAKKMAAAKQMTAAKKMAATTTKKTFSSSGMGQPRMSRTTKTPINYHSQPTMHSQSTAVQTNSNLKSKSKDAYTNAYRIIGGALCAILILIVIYGIYKFSSSKTSDDNPTFSKPDDDDDDDDDEGVNSWFSFGFSSSTSNSDTLSPKEMSAVQSLNLSHGKSKKGSTDDPEKEKDKKGSTDDPDKEKNDKKGYTDDPEKENKEKEGTTGSANVTKKEKPPPASKIGEAEQKFKKDTDDAKTSITEDEKESKNKLIKIDKNLKLFDSLMNKIKPSDSHNVQKLLKSLNDIKVNIEKDERSINSLYDKAKNTYLKISARVNDTELYDKVENISTFKKDAEITKSKINKKLASAKKIANSKVRSSVANLSFF